MISGLTNLCLEELEKMFQRFIRFHSPVNQRLSRLYDAKFDGDSIDEEVFKIKENEYKASAAEIKSQIRTLGEGNLNF